MKSMKLLGVVLVIVVASAASAGLYFPRPDLINRQTVACRPDFEHPPRCLSPLIDPASETLLAEQVLAGPSPDAGLLWNDWVQTIAVGSALQQARNVQEASAR